MNMCEGGGDKLTCVREEVTCEYVWGGSDKLTCVREGVTS